MHLKTLPLPSPKATFTFLEICYSPSTSQYQLLFQLIQDAIKKLSAGNTGRKKQYEDDKEEDFFQNKNTSKIKDEIIPLKEEEESEKEKEKEKRKLSSDSKNNSENKNFLKKKHKLESKEKEKELVSYKDYYTFGYRDPGKEGRKAKQRKGGRQMG